MNELWCDDCHVFTRGGSCPHCGRNLGAVKAVDKADELDDMVSRASVPTLASLFKAGRKAGLIVSTQAYT